MAKKSITPLVLIFGLFLISKPALSHCEIPCGIFGDSLQFALLKEHVETIKKSMNLINELSAASTPDYNQLVRWVMNKEEHAKKMQDIVSQYFLHQRVKMPAPEDAAGHEKYIKQLTAAHAVLVLAMKTKQTTDLASVEKLHDAVHKFEHAYYGEHKH